MALILPGLILLAIASAALLISDPFGTMAGMILLNGHVTTVDSSCWICPT